MNLKEYTDWVWARLHTSSPVLQNNPTNTQYDAQAVLLAAMGLAGEAGEVLDETKKLLFHGKPYASQREKIKIELGDQFFYFVAKARAHGLTIDEIIEANVEKLIARDGANSEYFGNRARG